jgi:hypothetical protein
MSHVVVNVYEKKDGHFAPSGTHEQYGTIALNREDLHPLCCDVNPTPAICCQWMRKGIGRAKT